MSGNRYKQNILRAGILALLVASLMMAATSCQDIAVPFLTENGPETASFEASTNSSTASTPVTATPTPTLTPTPTPTPSPTPTPTPSPTPTPQPPDTISWYDGYADPNTIIPRIVENPEDLTVLVNKYFAIPEDYVPELVDAESSDDQQLRPEADEAWDQMREDCEVATGYTLYLCSAHRTWEEQAELFAKSVAKRGIGYCCSKNALEGRSEHNLGLAIDISTTGVREISSGFAETTAGSWVAEHCAEYGFIMRYPSDKTDITGYAYEPWHYRYVGTKLALELYASGQTLEEYYEQVPLRPEGES